jgi:hypothetical protein
MPKQAMNGQAAVADKAKPSGEAQQIRPPLRHLLSQFGKDTQWSCVFSADSAPCSASGLYSHALVKKGEVTRLVLSAGDPGAGCGKETAGYNFELPQALEKSASGRPITISILARSMEPKATRFACAYSTNDVGNSGWRWLEASPEWAVHTIGYDVPQMAEGNGDFVGLLPAQVGEPAVEVAAIAIAFAP